MRVTRIEIRNIRSVEQLTVTPDPDGVTAIVGRYGSGKTTILEAVAWALYGELPGGLTQATARRTGAGDEECYADVSFRIGENVHRVRRSLRQAVRKGESTEVADAAMWRDGQAVEGITPAKLTTLVADTLGMSGRAFRGAFFMAQGQLTALVEGTPGQVQECFEDQTGLAGLRAPIREAATLSTDARNRANALPGTPDELQNAQVTEQDADRRHQTLASERSRVDAELAEHEHENAQASQRLEALLAAERTAGQARERLAGARARAELERERLQEVEIAADDAGLDHDASAESLTALAASAGQREQATRTLVREMQASFDGAEQATSNLTNATTAAETVNSEQLRVSIVDNHARLSATQERAESNSRRAAQAQTLVDALQKSITAISATQEARCPTCHQPLEHPDALLAELQREMAGAQTAAQAAQHDANASRIALDAAHESFATATSAKRDGQALLDARAHAQAIHAAAALRLSTVSEQTTELGCVASLPEQQLTELAIRADTAAAARHRSREMVALVERLTQARARHAAADTAARDALAAMTDAPAANDIETARRASDEAQRGVIAVRESAARLSTSAKLAQAEHDRALTDLQAIQARLHAKRAALTDAEVTRLAADLLAAQRSDLLAEHTVAISAAASDVLGRLEGEMTAFQIDGDFIPRVVLENGDVRATRALSGGEKALAALAFRLGIAERIAGAIPGMLFADEITAALDDDARRATVSMLRDLGIPLVIVSHSPEATDIATEVVRLTRGHGEPTTIPAG